MDASYHRANLVHRSAFNHSANDPAMRRIKYGPIRPMHEPTLLQRLLGRR